VEDRSAMSAAVVELHPEELLDREARGTIGVEELAVLGRHCVRCAACRYERTMRTLFAASLEEGGSGSGSGSEGEGGSGSEGEGGSGPAAIGRGRIGRFVGGALALVAAACAVAGAAPGEELRTRSGHVVVDARAAAEARPLRGRMARREEQRAVVRVPSAAMLFEQASRARVRGDYATALARYRRLQQQYPATRETRVSYVVMGRMQLDRGDAASALDTFERYRANGDLDLDSLVMAGRALALDEVGSEGSSGAWAALLASHPDTPYAEHARLRVAACSLSL
jgi:hypothetical protein